MCHPTTQFLEKSGELCHYLEKSGELCRYLEKSGELCRLLFYPASLIDWLLQVRLD